MNNKDKVIYDLDKLLIMFKTKNVQMKNYEMKIIPHRKDVMVHDAKIGSFTDVKEYIITFTIKD